MKFQNLRFSWQKGFAFLGKFSYDFKKAFALFKIYNFIGRRPIEIYSKIRRFCALIGDVPPSSSSPPSSFGSVRTLSQRVDFIYLLFLLNRCRFLCRIQLRVLSLKSRRYFLKPRLHVIRVWQIFQFLYYDFLSGWLDNRRSFCIFKIN